jgi:hypothetical protein
VPGDAPAGASDEPGKRKKYLVRPKPELLSKFMQQHLQQDEPAAGSDGSDNAVTADEVEVREASHRWRHALQVVRVLHLPGLKPGGGGGGSMRTNTDSAGSGPGTEQHISARRRFCCCRCSSPSNP